MLSIIRFFETRVTFYFSNVPWRLSQNHFQFRFNFNIYNKYHFLIDPIFVRNTKIKIY